MPAKPPVILMYHGTPSSGGDDIYALSASLFRRHLDYLMDHGWHTLTLGKLMNGGDYPERSVVITFDDGYEDNFENAFLPLLSRGMVATWFIVASAIGGASNWLKGNGRNRPLLTRGQILDMDQAGMEIGSHGYRHVSYPALSREEQQEEMVASREKLEDLLGKSVQGFAFPYGNYNEESLEALRYSGYSYACTTRSGRFNPMEDPFQVRRVTIYSGDNEKILARKLIFADNDVSWKKMTRYYLERLHGRLWRPATNPDRD